jgi:Zn-dependent protease
MPDFPPDPYLQPPGQQQIQPRTPAGLIQETQPQRPPTLGERIKRFFAPMIAALAMAWKWILIGLKVGLPFLKMAGSMVIAFGAYALAFGWQFGAGVVLLIFIHEMGHLIAARITGLKVSLPLFIPFFGARILMREMPRNAWIEAINGIGGPILGSIGALAAFGLFFVTHNELFLVLTYFGFFINLFNLIPIIPLDGGRIVSAISPWLWVAGLCFILPYLAYRVFTYGLLGGFGMIFVIAIVFTSLPRVIALFRGHTPEQARYYECTPAQRIVMALLYFSLIGSLYYGMQLTSDLLPPGAI